jgi:hypothetical protein
MNQEVELICHLPKLCNSLTMRIFLETFNFVNDESAPVNLHATTYTSTGYPIERRNWRYFVATYSNASCAAAAAALLFLSCADACFAAVTTTSTQPTSTPRYPNRSPGHSHRLTLPRIDCNYGRPLHRCARRKTRRRPAHEDSSSTSSDDGELTSAERGVAGSGRGGASGRGSGQVRVKSPRSGAAAAAAAGGMWAPEQPPRGGAAAAATADASQRRPAPPAAGLPRLRR